MLHILFILTITSILYSLVLNFVMMFHGKRIKNLEKQIYKNNNYDDTTHSGKLNIHTSKIAFSDLFQKHNKRNDNFNTIHEDSFMKEYTPTNKNEFNVKYQKKDI